MLVSLVLLGCSDDADEPATDFVQKPDSRLVKVQSVGLAAFGPINPHTAIPADAVAAFGEPSSIDRHGELCARRWPDIGLTIDFAAPGGGDPCGAAAGIEPLRLARPAAAEADWRTAEGIRPGMSVAKARRIYPEAHRGRSGDWLVLVEPPAPTGSQARPVLAVTTANGRVDALIFPIDSRSGLADS